MTPEQANAVWDILVKYAGASNTAADRADFVYHQTHGCDEYRFQGWLGFGGKFWATKTRWHVTAYPEDVAVKPEMHETIAVTDAALAGLRASFVALGKTLED